MTDAVSLPEASNGRRRFLRLGGALAAAVVSPRAWAAQMSDTGPDAGVQAITHSAAQRVLAFDEVWTTVSDRFYDPRLHGLDWIAIRERYLPRAASASSDDLLAEVVNSMLSELRASHTRYYTANEPEYYQLADIFAGALRRRGLDRAFPGGRISYPGIGVFIHRDAQGRAFISGVIEATPAQQAGFLVGDEIVSVDGQQFQPVGSFRGKVGKQVLLTLRRTAGGPVVQLPVTPAELEPNKMFLKSVDASVHVVQASGRRVGYVRVWSYAGYAYQRALERLIVEGPLKDADSLIWDLRDGWGGAIPQYLDLFNPRAPTLRATDRRGEADFENVKWRKPVAMLVNGGTRSGKEVLAYGFKKYGLGEVIGAHTEGAVLGATAILMSNSALLLLAVDDVSVDGERLEGIGVAPTIEVPFDLSYAAGRDPQLDRAVAVLSRA